MSCPWSCVTKVNRWLSKIHGHSMKSWKSIENADILILILQLAVNNGKSLRRSIEKKTELFISWGVIESRRAAYQVSICLPLPAQEAAASVLHCDSRYENRHRLFQLIHFNSSWSEWYLSYTGLTHDWQIRPCGGPTHRPTGPIVWRCLDQLNSYPLSQSITALCLVVNTHFRLAAKAGWLISHVIKRVGGSLAGKR